MEASGVVVVQPEEQYVFTEKYIDKRSVWSQIPVVRFNVVKQIASIISDKRVMKRENLVVDPVNHFGPPPTRQEGENFEVQHGARYRKVWNQKLKILRKKFALV